MSDQNTNTNPEGTGSEGQGAVDPQSAEGMVQVAIKSGSIPQKFLNEDGTPNIERMVESYRALEQKQSGRSVEETGESNEGATASTQDSSTGGDSNEGPSSFDEALSGESKPKSTVWGDVEKELQSTGTLSEATVRTLKEQGVPESVIKSSMDGFKASQKEAFNKAAELLGGRENLDATMQYVNETYSGEQKAGILQALRSPTGNQVLMGLHAEMRSKKGNAPINTDRDSGLPSVTSIKPYKTALEMTTAISDPKYRTDSEHRAMVEARIAKTHGHSDETIRRYLAKA